MSGLKAEIADNPKTRGRQRKFSDNPVGLRIIEALAGRQRSWLAENTGISTSSISDYIANGISKADAAVAISRALKVDLEWLLTGETASRDRLVEHGDGHRFVNAEAEHLLGEIDAFIEARDDAAVRARSSRLQALVADPDISPALRLRVDYLLNMMGDAEAGKRYRASTKKIAQSRAYAMHVVEDALDQARLASETDIGEGVRQAIIALCGHLFIMRLEDVSPDSLDWPLQSLVRAIAARIASARSPD